MNKVLIVDDEQDLLEINAFCFSQNFDLEYELEFAKNGIEAVSKIKNDSFDLCICDHNMPDGNGSIVCEFISKNSINTKFVLCSSVVPSELPTIYTKDKLFFNIVKPDVVNGFQELAKRIKSEKREELSNVSTSKNDFIKFDIRILPWLEVLPCDLYISLSSDKMLKYLNKGDNVNSYIVKVLKNRGVSYLFYKGDEKEILNQFINKKMVEKSKLNKINIDDKIRASVMQMLKVLESLGIKVEDYGSVKENIDNSIKEIFENDSDLKSIHRHVITGDYQTNKFLLQSILVQLIGKKLSWFTSKHLKNMQIAAFYQDFALDAEKLMKLEDVNSFNSVQYSLTYSEIESYLNHPHVIKDILQKMNSTTDDVVKLVLEHHELPNGTGFPRKLNFNTIRPLSALFITTSVISSKILNNSLDNLNEYFEMNKFNEGSFAEITAVIKGILKH